MNKHILTTQEVFEIWMEANLYWSALSISEWRDWLQELVNGSEDREVWKDFEGMVSGTEESEETYIEWTKKLIEVWTEMPWLKK